MKKLTWKKWRVGLLLTVAMACVAAGAGLVEGITWRAFVVILCTSLMTHVGAYLAKSPLDQVDDGNAENQTENKS